MAAPNVADDAGSDVAGDAADTGPRQILSFTLAGETFGVDILRVREIRGWSSVTRIPEAPAYVLGVLNLRGAVVPIVDMRIRVGEAPVEPTALTVIIVLSIETPRERRDFGLVVDGVSDVIDLTAADIQPAPELNLASMETLVRNLATVNGRIILLLEIDQLLESARGDFVM
jgi:purine-binding chemotaxis protein CheW